MATYNEALEVYRNAVGKMEEAIDRLDEIDALPGWQRWLYGWERRCLERSCYEIDRQLALLQARMESSQ